MPDTGHADSGVGSVFSRCPWDAFFFIVSFAYAAVRIGCSIRQTQYTEGGVPMTLVPYTARIALRTVCRFGHFVVAAGVVGSAKWLHANDADDRFATIYGRGNRPVP